jgi:hypothetical protein
MNSKIAPQGKDETGEPELTRLVVYIGRRLGGDKKENIAFLPFVEGENGWVLPSNEEAISQQYRPAKFPKLQPGAVVSVTGPSDSTINFSTLRYVRMWEDEAARLRWAARDAAEHSRFTSYKMGEKQRNELHAQLEPVRVQIQRAVGANRAALIAEVIRYLL